MTYLSRQCLKYVESRKSTLWAHFNIHTDEGKREAAAWLASTIEQVIHLDDRAHQRANPLPLDEEVIHQDG